MNLPLAVLGAAILGAAAPSPVRACEAPGPCMPVDACEGDDCTAPPAPPPPPITCQGRACGPVPEICEGPGCGAPESEPPAPAPDGRSP
jgi:hypothetical protein